MTIQPKLPEWAEEFINQHTQTFSLRFPDQQEDFMRMGDVRTLASRLMAEIIPEGHYAVSHDDLNSLLAALVSDYKTPRTEEVITRLCIMLGDRNMALITNPGPAAEPKCKTCNDVGAVLGKQDGILQHWGPCPDCSSPNPKPEPEPAQ